MRMAEGEHRGGDGAAIQRLDGRAQAEEEPQGWLTKAAEPREGSDAVGVMAGNSGSS